MNVIEPAFEHHMYTWSGCAGESPPKASKVRQYYYVGLSSVTTLDTSMCP
jgi:hypothetical protein